ncbi:MAG: FG-GAP repeat protein, partial [Planctomycetaceae bacterium]|nr:FG-GAP repeat protein [Planctomycetaceae bacterium]
FLSIDGDTIVVGAIQYNSTGPGKVLIYERNRGGENNWGLVKKLVAEDSDVDDKFGHGVSISGNTLVVGDESHDSHGINAGAAYVFQKDNGGPNAWGLVKKLTRSDAKSYLNFARDVSIYGDILVAGAPAKRSPESGACYVFQRNKRDPTQWEEVVKLVGSDAAIGDGFELWVANDSDLILVSAPSDDDRGSDAGCVYIFERR